MSNIMLFLSINPDCPIELKMFNIIAVIIYIICSYISFLTSEMLNICRKQNHPNTSQLRSS